MNAKLGKDASSLERKLLYQLACNECQDDVPAGPGSKKAL